MVILEASVDNGLAQKTCETAMGGVVAGMKIFDILKILAKRPGDPS